MPLDIAIAVIACAAGEAGLVFKGMFQATLNAPQTCVRTLRLLIDIEAAAVDEQIGFFIEGSCVLDSNSFGGQVAVKDELVGADSDKWIFHLAENYI